MLGFIGSIEGFRISQFSVDGTSEGYNYTAKMTRNGTDICDIHYSSEVDSEVQYTIYPEAKEDVKYLVECISRILHDTSVATRDCEAHKWVRNWKVGVSETDAIYACLELLLFIDNMADAGRKFFTEFPHASRLFVALSGYSFFTNTSEVREINKSAIPGQCYYAVYASEYAVWESLKSDMECVSNGRKIRASHITTIKDTWDFDMPGLEAMFTCYEL